MAAFLVSSAAFGADAPKKKPAAPAAKPASPPPKRASGEASLRAGQKLLADGKFHEAAEKLSESYRIEPKTGTLMALANAHDKEGRTATAWAEYKKVLDESTKQGNKKRAEEARARAAETYKKISYVKLDVGTSNAIEVQIDGKIIDKSAWATPQAFDPGPHEVRVGGVNGATKTISMTLQPGPVTQSLALPTLTAADEPPTLAASPSPTPDAPKESPVTPAAAPKDEPQNEPSNEALLSASGRTSTKEAKSGSGTGRTVGYILGGVGLVGIGVGSYFGITALGNKKDVDAHCATAATESLTSNAIGCDQTGFKAQQDAHTNGNIATIAMGVGAAALVTGVVLIIVSRGSSDKPATALHVSPTAPTIGAGGGMQIGGAF
jgi:hypothetical protein